MLWCDLGTVGRRTGPNIRPERGEDWNGFSGTQFGLPCNRMLVGPCPIGLVVGLDRTGLRPWKVRVSW